MKNKTKGFEVSRQVQYRTVNELIERSRPDFTYYVLLIVSTIVITAGLLLNNTAIVIGGMLITPLLTPILVIALGIAVGDTLLLGRVVKFTGLSFMYVLLAGVFLTLVFGAPSELTIIANDLRTAALYFVVALASGVAATFAWIQKEASEALPGIAIAVALVPPIALIGIGFGSFNFDLSAFFFIIFILNLFGIIMGSLMVFTMSKFNKAEKKINEKNTEIIIEDHLKKLEKEEVKREQRPEETSAEGLLFEKKD